MLGAVLGNSKKIARDILKAERALPQRERPPLERFGIDLLKELSRESAHAGGSIGPAQ